MDFRGNALMLLAGGYVVYCLIPKPFLRNETRIQIGQPASHSVSLNDPQRITLSKFNQLQVGMHSKDVVKIFGRPGKAFTPKTTDAGNDGAKMCVWKNAGGGLCRVDFKDDLVTGKRQVNLQD